MVENNNSYTVSRRKVLQSAALAVTGFGAVGTVSADGEASSGTDAYGITDEVKSLLDSGRFEEAEEILNKNDISYGHEKHIVGSSTGDGKDTVSNKTINKTSSGGSFTTQTTYSKSDSWVSIFVFNDQDNIYTATGYAHLRGSNNVVEDLSNAADAMGLTYYSNDWAPVNPNPDEVTASIINFGGDGGGPSVSQVDYEPNSGIGAKVHFPNQASQAYETDIKMATRLEDRTDSGTDPTPVLFEYQQNAAYSGVLASVGITVAGVGITVDLSNAKKVWRTPVSAGAGVYKEER